LRIHRRPDPKERNYKCQTPTQSSLFLNLAEIVQKQRVIRVSLAFIYPFISPTQPVHPATFFCSRRGSHNFGRTGRIIHVFATSAASTPEPQLAVDAVVDALQQDTRLFSFASLVARLTLYASLRGRVVDFAADGVVVPGVSSTLIVFRDGYT
jgi:hypothetical protein